MKRLKIKVTGDVQGVFYRFSAKQEAEKHGLTGFAQNKPDNSVLVIVEGDGGALGRFTSWLKTGPPMAEVDNIEITEEEPSGKFKDFEVR